MCSRVQQSSSASESSASTCTPDRESLLIRQKKVLTRDDSGVFSSPSPLTPSRGPLTVFSLPPFPDPSGVACISVSTAAPVSSPLDPGTIMSDSREDGKLPASLNHPRANASLGLKQAPEQDEALLQAFYCRQEIGLERWATCSHAHCTTIRDQWRHLITCGQVCQDCQNFQRRILLHAAQCSDENCFVSLCPDAKNRLASATTRRPGPPQRSNSVQSSLGSPHPPQFLSLNSQGSLDDMSPMSPLDYHSFVRDLRQVGAGTLPRYLSLRASEIMRSMESDGPLDKFAPGENSNPTSAVPQYNPVGAGILSPIEEHPSSEAGSKYPSQIILHPLEPEFLTQGRDGRYLHRRDYDLNEHLGTGGFGTCACARDYKTDKMFVIKSNKFSDEKMVNTLKAESDILSRIPHHTNITTFLGAVLEEEQAKDGALRHCRLMMELAEHGSLASMLQSDEGESEPLPLDQSLFYLYQILQGVFHLHSLSILHLDIKAENVLVLEGGRRLKLTDFGTAAHIDDIAGSISKLKGVTPHFTSPEIIRGDVPSFSSDIWSTVCVLIQLLTAQLPGYFTGNMSRESMMYTLGKYKDEDIEKLIPLSQLESQQDMPEEVSAIFRDALCVDPTARPTALQLMAYSALKDACEYEQYFDIDCSQFSEQQEDGSSLTAEGAEFVSMESSYHTLPTSLPHLIVRASGPDSDVSLDIPTRGKRPSQDSGVSSHYDRKQSEVYPIGDPNDSGIDTPGQEIYPPLKGALKLQAMNSREGMITEEREGEERLTSVPDRTHSQPEPPTVDYSLIASQYRRRSMSATYNRRTSDVSAPEVTGLKFGRHYTDVNETFFSLPTKSSNGFVTQTQTQKVRPNFVHLIHSNSAPVVMSDNKERGAGAGGVAKKQNGDASGRLRRSSSEVYVDRGPDIDTPEEKKKKRELELAAAAAKEAEERERQEQEQMVTMAAALRINNSSPGEWSPPMQRSHAHSASVDQSDRGSYSTGHRTRQNVPAAAPQGPSLPYRVQQKFNGSGGFVQETLV